MKSKSRVTVQARSGTSLLENVRRTLLFTSTTTSLDFMRAGHVDELLNHLGNQGLYVNDDELRLEFYYETPEQEMKVAEIHSPGELSEAVNDQRISRGTLRKMMIGDSKRYYTTTYPPAYKDNRTICDITSEDGGIIGRMEYYEDRFSEPRIAPRVKSLAGIGGSLMAPWPVGFLVTAVLYSTTHNSELGRAFLIGSFASGPVLFPASHYLHLNNLKDGITVNLEYVGNTSEQLAGYNQIVHDLKHLKLGKPQPPILASPLEQIVKPETTLNI
jgi:hypothetical protein